MHESSWSYIWDCVIFLLLTSHREVRIRVHILLHPGTFCFISLQACACVWLSIHGRYHVDNIVIQCYTTIMSKLPEGGGAFNHSIVNLRRWFSLNPGFSCRNFTQRLLLIRTVIVSNLSFLWFLCRVLAGLKHFFRYFSSAKLKTRQSRKYLENSRNTAVFRG